MRGQIRDEHKDGGRTCRPSLGREGEQDGRQAILAIGSELEAHEETLDVLFSRLKREASQSHDSVG